MADWMPSHQNRHHQPRQAVVREICVAKTRFNFIAPRPLVDFISVLKNSSIAIEDGCFVFVTWQFHKWCHLNTTSHGEQFSGELRDEGKPKFNFNFRSTRPGRIPNWNFKSPPWVDFISDGIVCEQFHWEIYERHHINILSTPARQRSQAHIKSGRLSKAQMKSLSLIVSQPRPISHSG